MLAGVPHGWRKEAAVPRNCYSVKISRSEPQLEERSRRKATLKGMWAGVGCEAGRQFPDVTHKDLKSVWEGVFLPDVSDVEQNVRGSAIGFLM